MSDCPRRFIPPHASILRQRPSHCSCLKTQIWISEAQPWPGTTGNQGASSEERQKEMEDISCLHIGQGEDTYGFYHSETISRLRPSSCDSEIQPVRNMRMVYGSTRWWQHFSPGLAVLTVIFSLQRHLNTLGQYVTIRNIVNDIAAGDRASRRSFN